MDFMHTFQSVPSPVNFDVNNQSQRKPKQSTKRKNRSERENELVCAYLFFFLKLMTICNYLFAF